MKKYVKGTIGLTAGILGLIMAFMIVIDPLFQYHYPWFGMEPILSGESKEQYYVPGMAKSFEYDTAIIGTSMSENFRPSWFENIWGGKTVKLTISGSYPVEYHKVLKLVLNHEDIANIVMNIDSSYLQSDPNTGRWEDLPDYLYDYNFLNDGPYLFNKEVIFNFGQKLLRRNHSRKYTDFDLLFSWDSNAEYGREIVQGLIEPEYKRCDSNMLSCYEAWSEENIESLFTVIKNNPDVHFTVFIAPYSIAYWYDEYRAERVDYWERRYASLFDRLLRLDNVSIYFFTDEKAITMITDLDNYKDKTHYSAEVSRYIVDCIQNQENQLSNGDYKKVLNTFFNYVRNFDYSQLTTLMEDE